MKHRIPTPAVVLTLAALGVLFAGCKKQQDDNSGPVSFAESVKPILEAKCVICHNSDTMVGQLNVEHREAAFGKSERGVFIVPGDPESSLLYTITLAPHGKRELPAGIEKPMPEKMPDLSAAEKGTLKQWILEGAKWPDGPEGHVNPPQVPTPEA